MCDVVIMQSKNSECVFELEVCGSDAKEQLSLYVILRVLRMFEVEI
jgi:hypothetical protein